MKIAVEGKRYLSPEKKEVFVRFSDSRPSRFVNRCTTYLFTFLEMMTVVSRLFTCCIGQHVKMAVPLLQFPIHCSVMLQLMFNTMNPYSSMQWVNVSKKVQFSLNGHSEPENLKKSRTKKLVKSNKTISHDQFFWPNSIFYNLKKGQKSFFELGKSLKLPKMQFHVIFVFIYLISQVFSPELF